MDELLKLTNNKFNENKEEKIIGDYLIKHTIGKGTFGKVKIGLHIPTNENVAIKILEKNKITDTDDITRIEREMKICKSLNHLNVVKIFEILQDEENHYIIMEQAKGGELFNYITNKRRLNEQEASFFFYQIINGMEYLHKSNIVHRDLKPENLLLTEDKIIKIIDFGLSNEFSNKNFLLSTPCGSPCYAAPEMVLGKKYSGIKIDIWATGIILFAMICGYLPFEDKKNEILFKKIIECDFEFPNFITHNVKDLIKKILVTNPCNRATIEDIKKHSFYKQGKIAFFKEQKFLLENIFDNDNENNKEFERLINEKIIMEMNKKLNKNFTLNDIDDIKNELSRKNEILKINNNYNLNNETKNNRLKCENEYFVNEINFEEYKKEYNLEEEKENKKYIYLKDRVENNNSKTNSLLSSKNNFYLNKKYSVTFEIIYNNILKDKIFIKNLLSKLPKESIENNTIDRESRRSKSITNNQIYFNQPKINININCVKKFENVNLNIVPIVSISSVPFSSRTTNNKNLEKNNFNKINNAYINNNYNTINSTSNSTNLNQNKFSKKDNTKVDSLSSYNANINNLQTNNTFNNNLKNFNTINNNKISFESNNNLNNLYTNFNNTISINDNINTTRNKLIKYNTGVLNTNSKYAGNANSIEEKSMYTQFKDGMVNYNENKIIHKNVKQYTTLKKNNLNKIINNKKENQYATINYVENENDKFIKLKNYSVDNNIFKSERNDENRFNNKNTLNNYIKKKNIINSNFNYNKGNIIKDSNVNKKRNSSYRIENPKTNDFSISLINNIFRKSTFNSTKINNLNNNNTIDDYSNQKHNHKVSEEIITYNKNYKNDINNNLKNKKYASNNNLINNFNLSSKNFTKDSLNKNDLKNTNFNTINSKVDNGNFKNQNNEKVKLNIIDIETYIPKSPKKPSESLKVTEIKKINNFREPSLNSDKKILNSNKKVITSSDRIFSENQEYIKNFEKKFFNNNLSKNKYGSNVNTNNNTIQSEKNEKEFIKPNFSCEENKQTRLKRIVKNSLGSSSNGFELSCIQKMNSPKKNNINHNKKNKKSFTTVNSKDNFKISLSTNYNNTININTNTSNNTINNIPQKKTAENSTRVIHIKNISNVNSKMRPLSNQFEKINTKFALCENNKMNLNQKEFDNFYKKVTESLKNNSKNKNEKYTTDIISKENNNIINVKEYVRKGNTFNFTNNNINTIDVDLYEENNNHKMKNKNQENKIIANNKTNKDWTNQNYVSLDLFNLKNIDNNTLKFLKSQNDIKKRNNICNSFKDPITKDKKLINDNTLSNYSNFYSKNSNLNNKKLNVKSNSISKGKITLSNKPLIKK